MNARYKESLARRTLYNEGRGVPKKWALCLEYQNVLDRYANSLTGKALHTQRIYRSGAGHFLTFL